jgi:HK97 family phage prohead protease
MVLLPAPKSKGRDQMVDALDILRKDSFRKRVHGIAGGNRVLWTEKDLVDIHSHTWSLKMEQIIQRPIETKRIAPPNVDKLSLAKIGVELRDFNPDDSAFLGLATNETNDHMNDSVKPRGVDDTVFRKNGAVLDHHDSSKPPVAISGRPFLSGDNLLAIFRFPKPGVSSNSDQIASAVRARLVRGLSIGFIPVKWSFSKDPTRPLGVDFHEIKLLEFSVCSIPANPDCYILGSVAGNQSSPADAKIAGLRREARALAAKGRELVASIADTKPQSREQRMAEARALRRIAMDAGK